MHHGRPLSYQPWDESARAAAADDLLDMAEETLLALNGALRRPEIRFVEHEMQRLLVCLVKRLGKGCP